MSQRTGSRDARVRSESLLHVIQRDGWTDDAAVAFESQYGDDIRRLTVLYLWKLGLITFRFDPARAQRILQGQRLELFENTLSDVWIELTGGLVGRFLQDAAGREATLPFPRYLAGVIRNLVIDNARSLGLLPRESERAILRSLCGAKRTETRKAHTARALFQLETKAQREILLHCAGANFNEVYRCIYRVLHHFFEQFLPLRCPEIRRLRSGSAIVVLAEEYIESGEFQAGLSYSGHVTPWDPTSLRRVHDSKVSDSRTEEDFLEMAGARRQESVS